MTGRREGFVLIAVLWLLVALGAVALDAALRSRARNLTAANFVDEARARGAAQAGVEYARSRLTAAVRDREEELRAEGEGEITVEVPATAEISFFTVAGTTVTINGRPVSPLALLGDPWRAPHQLMPGSKTFGDATFALRVRDRGALLNLNTAGEESLRLFFSQGLDVDYAEASRLAQAILDWRDEDDSPRLHGAERDEYLREGAAVLPYDRPFSAVEELRHVRGMTPEIYEAALPHLTAFGESFTINVNAAPEPVLLAIPGMTTALAQEIVRRRSSGWYPRDASQLMAALPGFEVLFEANPELRRVITYLTTEVDLLVEGRVNGSPIAARERVVISVSGPEAVVMARRSE